MPLDSAIPYLARWPVLPIQNRASKGTLEGIVSLEDVLGRYQQQEMGVLERGCVKTRDSPLSPVGTAESSPGRSPGYDQQQETRSVPKGRLRMSQDEILGALES